MEDAKLNVEKKVAADFRDMEKALEARNPGVLELLRVYGGYEAAIVQAESYLGLIDLVPLVVSSSTDSNS